ncbi:MAG: DUF1853 family protein [Verrucomicrobiales bacterium]|nr:DUF1853 family protein [Verrucomicrobiales bacterium]
MAFAETQAAEDLRWLLDCSSLIQSELTFEFESSPLNAIDWEPVRRFHETKAAHRVGYYVESLIQSWLESQESVSDLRHGIQIRREKETLGELDFLFRQEGVLHHLEVALKLYLCFPEGAENGSCFVGPNATDSFERKRDRLIDKQLPFGKEHFPEIERSFHAVKGMIFYHAKGGRSVELPTLLNHGHARGAWIRESELEAFLERMPPLRKGRILKKPFWLAATGADLNTDEILTAASAHFEKWDGPVYLAVFEGNEEIDRLFIMPECWPEKR